VPVYSYKAVRLDGQVTEGERAAASDADLTAALQKEGLIPLKIRLAGGLRAYLTLGHRKRITETDVVLFTRELATLLGAGLPLDRSLQVLIDLAEEAHVRDMETAVQERVRGGGTFSQALEEQGGVFSRLYVNMVRAGEASGALESALARLSEYLEQAAELRDSIQSALVYPIILLVVAGLSLIVLLVFVVPQFSSLFEDMGAQLPTATRFVIALGDLFRGYWWAMLAALALGAAALKAKLDDPEFRAGWDARLLAMPVLGDLIWKLETARFCHTLGALLQSGMPMLGALRLAKEVVANRRIGDQLAAITEDLKHGKGLATPLADHAVLPKMALQMIRVGEESGNMEPMLSKVALVYDRETRSSVKRLLTLMEPILIIGMGMMVAGIIMSILVAILGANNLVA
jgi:general secretion pathway protein F